MLVLFKGEFYLFEISRISSSQGSSYRVLTVLVLPEYLEYCNIYIKCILILVYFYIDLNIFYSYLVLSIY